MTPPLTARTRATSKDAKTLREQAARWIVRRDRGFSLTEAEEFERWLRADPRHAAAIERLSVAWGLLDRISPPVVARSTVKKIHFSLFHPLMASGLAAAAILVIAYLGWWRPTDRVHDGEARTVESAGARARFTHRVTFSDGTVARLDAASEVVEQFTPTERRVLLVRGEAYFNVAKNPSRPFIVRTDSVEVRAVGTRFNVNLERATVEVLVTEGRVRVTPNGSVSESVLVDAGQRAVVALEADTKTRSVMVTSATPADVAASLAAQDSLLNLGGATLAELAREFQGRTGHRLVVDDPALGEMRIGGRFRADDVDGFVRVLEENYGLQAERRGPGETVLHLRK